MIAALFPGQGFEEPGMARALLDHPLVAEASEACGVDVRRALERWTPELAKTAVLQPALVAVSLADWETRGARADVFCGHSVGEIAAWAAAGAIPARDAVRLAARRGAAMQRAADAHPGGMVAFDERELTAAAGLDLAARNAPHRVVYSGELAAVLETERRGARRLAVGGAWHSRLMRGVAVATPDARAPAGTFVTCLDGRVVERPDLAAQVASPVRWDLAMATLLEIGADGVCMFGPRRVMRSLVRENAAALLERGAA